MRRQDFIAFVVAAVVTLAVLALCDALSERASSLLEAVESAVGDGE